MHVQASRWWLRATGDHLDIVGFAARYPADPALPDRADWHQVAMTQMTGGGFDAAWQPGELPVPLRPGTPVLLAAAACLGGDGQTQVLTVGRAAGEHFTGLPASGLSATERADAARPAATPTPGPPAQIRRSWSGSRDSLRALFVLCPRHLR